MPQSHPDVNIFHPMDPPVLQDLDPIPPIRREHTWHMWTKLSSDMCTDYYGNPITISFTLFTLPKTSHVRPWKCMVGRWNRWNWPIFNGRIVRFREGTLPYITIPCSTRTPPGKDRLRKISYLTGRPWWSSLVRKSRWYLGTWREALFSGIAKFNIYIYICIYIYMGKVLRKYIYT